VNIACHVKQPSKTTSFGGTLSWQWRGGMSIVRVVQTANTRILRHRFPGASETVGQVFKFVWRLHWKINAVCMSLSPLVSFKSRFVTYLLNFPLIWIEPSTFPSASVNSCHRVARSRICCEPSVVLTVVKTVGVRAEFLRISRSLAQPTIWKSKGSLSSSQYPTSVSYSEPWELGP